jgi:hypothetical protein
MPVRITSYRQVFEMLGINENDVKVKSVIGNLENEGHTEKSICYSVYRSQDKLMKFSRDSRFWGIFINEVRKWSWPKGDTRWDDYWKRKNEEKKAIEAEKIKQEQLARERKHKERYPGFIYFMQGESGGPIKIVFTKKIKERFSTLQSGYPDTLIILATTPGNTNAEQLAHEKLQNFKIRGEWFKPSTQVTELIQAIKRGGD